MRKAVSLALLLTLATLSTVRPVLHASPLNQNQQAELTNKDVLDMIKAGLSTEIIVTKIRTSPSKFDTSSATLAELKAANVPDAVILAMVEGPATATSPSGLTKVAEITVPDGTEIEIQLHNTLSGQTAKVGDIVDFTVVRAVQVNGVTVFEKDASARAKITTAKGAASWGRAGKLEWIMQDVQAADGNRIPARFTKREVGDSKGGRVAAAAVATTVLLGPVGLFWGFKKGKPAIIPAGNRYTVFVHGEAKIHGKKSVAAR
jgi:hypothetical protein